MPQSALPQAVQTGQSNPTPSQKLGAFDAPTPSKKAVASAISTGTTVPQASTHTAVLNTGSGQVAPTAAPVPIPDVKWQAPTTVAKASSTAPKAGWQKAVATFVQDGDTANVKLGDNSSVVCRIDGIDAPETAKPKYNKPGQPYGDAAARTLKRMIENKEVTVKVSYPEKGKNFDRAICQIEFEGADVSKAMIAEGMAWVYDRYAKDPSYKAEVSKAKAARKGLWQDPNPIKPEIFRRAYMQ